jgi:hypothetical protein
MAPYGNVTVYLKLQMAIVLNHVSEEHDFRAEARSACFSETLVSNQKITRRSNPEYNNLGLWYDCYKCRFGVDVTVGVVA